MSPRRHPRWLLPLALVALVVVEVWTVVQVGRLVGPGWTILLLLAVGVVGAWLVKREGARAWRALQESLAEGRMPRRELTDGALVLLGGALMLAPGFLTDVVGLLLILPTTRPLGRAVVAAVVGRRLETTYAAPFGGPLSGAGGAAYGRGDHSDDRPGSGDVVQGQVVDPPRS